MNNRIPKLRFKEFSSNWRITKLENISSIIMGQSPLGNTYTNFENKYILVQGNSDLLNGYVKPRIWTSQLTKMAKKGDIIMSVRAPAGEVGRTNYDCVIGRGVAAIKGNNFIYYNLFKLNSENYWKRISCGSTFESLNSDNIKSLELIIPEKIEQEKIGKFFLVLDNIITLYKKKCEKLEIIRKSLIENVFIDLGFNQPNIRFKEFNSKWINKTFSELYKKNTVKNSNLKYDENNVISVANMYFKSDVKISNEEYLKTYNIFKIGDIAFEGNKSKNFTCGRFVENTIGDGIISHVFEVFSPIIEYDLWFWKYLINNEKIMKNILMKSTKATTMMSNLVSKDFLEQKIKLPELKEQTKIGILLNTISYNITLCKREYCSTLNHKIHKLRIKKLKNLIVLSFYFVFFL
ncbi:restriction endonuclease subunit S [Ureaplasma ceti]|uniref:Restriction endonuclease subunit S n=1 Tax=Ureaplasma ceti TaxID=3119530 RepID=A0ABP9U643_9BACT